MELKEILARCDHTLLRVDATAAEIRALCDQGIRYGCASVCILVNSNATDFYAQAQVIQEQLRGIGINCELAAYDASTYSDVRNNQPDQWDAFITSFGPKVRGDQSGRSKADLERPAGLHV